MWSAILHDAREGHPALVTFAWVCVASAVATGIPLILDSRLVSGAPAWHKPLKFFLSSAIYSFTFAWYLGQDPDRERQRTRRGLASWLGTGIWVALAIELALIAMQAFRGVRDADILGGVVVIDMQVALRLHRDIHARMPRQEIEHVVEKADAGRDLRRAFAVEIDRHVDIGFLGGAFDRAFAHDLSGRWASVPNPKFAISNSDTCSELRILRDTRECMTPVWLWFRSPLVDSRRVLRDF